MHIRESITHLKDQLVEDDSPKPNPVTPTSKPVAVPPSFVPTTVPPSYVPAADVADHQDDAYQRLLLKTDFTTTPVYATINKYLAPLASMALDDKTKFKIAVQQAQAQEGIQADNVLGIFDQFKNVLAQEADKFAQTAAAATADQVEAKKSKAAEISAQIQTLQAQVAQLTEDSFAAQQKIQTAQHRFDVALQTRQTELDQEHTKYAGLLA